MKIKKVCVERVCHTDLKPGADIKRGHKHQKLCAMLFLECHPKYEGKVNQIFFNTIVLPHGSQMWTCAVWQRGSIGNRKTEGKRGRWGLQRLHWHPSASNITQSHINQWLISLKAALSMTGPKFWLRLTPTANNWRFRLSSVQTWADNTMWLSPVGICAHCPQPGVSWENVLSVCQDGSGGRRVDQDPEVETGERVHTAVLAGSGMYSSVCSLILLSYSRVQLWLQTFRCSLEVASRAFGPWHKSSFVFSHRWGKVNDCCRYRWSRRSLSSWGNVSSGHSSLGCVNRNWLRCHFPATSDMSAKSSLAHDNTSAVFGILLLHIVDSVNKA